MRHQYTPIFREVLTSSVWAQEPATRAVWLWFQLSADPEGFVPATVSGVAIGAHVSESEARNAIDWLEARDPDRDPNDPHEGRFIAKVARGWLVLGLEADRERAKEEARKARNRRYMQRRRAADRAVAANDTASTGESESPEVGSPKPKPKPKPKPISSEGDPPKPPAVADEPGYVTVSPAVMHRIPPDWQLADELVAEARMAGGIDSRSAV